MGNKINPLNVQELLSHIFDNDRRRSLDQFQNVFGEAVLAICELVKNCYAGFLQFENHPEPDDQFAYLTAHVYALVESLYTSSKLLVHGFLAPSGNQFRVALEATALSVLLSCRNDILVQTRFNKWVSRSFFDDFIKQKQWTKAHVAIKTLEKNREWLGFSSEAMSLLKLLKDLYNSYSHVSLLTIRSNILSPDMVSFGGGYEKEQRPLFEEELQVRRMFLEKVPTFLELLYSISISALERSAYAAGKSPSETRFKAKDI